METIKKYLPIAILIVIVLLSGLLTTRGDAKEPVKSQAVIELEKEMARDVPTFNELAPRLKKNRAALEALGWSFDDSKLTAVFQ